MKRTVWVDVAVIVGTLLLVELLQIAGSASRDGFTWIVAGLLGAVVLLASVLAVRDGWK